MLVKIFLALNTLIFSGYGLWCLSQPEELAAVIGYALETADAQIEVVAMYGGVQVAFGLYCLLGAWRHEYARPALVLLAVTTGGLVIARLFAFNFSVEPDFVGSVTSYTYGALGFELTVALLSLLALFYASPKAAGQ